MTADVVAHRVVIEIDAEWDVDHMEAHIAPQEPER